MNSSKQLEQEAQACRERLLEMVDELRVRLSPGQVVDELVGYAQDTTGGLFFRNLKRQVAENPVPLALAGAALAWFVLASSRAGRNADQLTGAAAEARTVGQQTWAEGQRQAQDEGLTPGGVAAEATDHFGEASLIPSQDQMQPLQEPRLEPSDGKRS